MSPRRDYLWALFEETVTSLLQEGEPEDEIASRVRELAEYERDLDVERHLDAEKQGNAA